MAEPIPPGGPAAGSSGSSGPPAAGGPALLSDPTDPSHIKYTAYGPPPGPVPLPPTFPPGPSSPPLNAPVPAPPPPPADGCPHPDLQPLWDAVGSIEEGITGIAVKVIASLDQVITNCQAKYNELASVVLGKLDVKLDDCAEVVSKAQTKCKKQLDQALTQAYSYAVPMGLCYPTAEQVLFGLQTGQCLQTLIPGWVPTGYDNISCAPEVCAPTNVVQGINVSQPTLNQGGTLVNAPTSTTTTTTSADGKETVNVTVNVPKEPAPQVTVNVPSTAPGTLQNSPQQEAVQIINQIKTTLEGILSQPGVIVSIPQSPGTPEKTYKENIDFLINLITSPINPPPPPPPPPPPAPQVPGDVAAAGPGVGGFAPPNWDSPLVCAGIDAFGDAFASGNLPMKGVLGFWKEGDVYMMPSWAVPVFQSLPRPLDVLFWGLGRIQWVMLEGGANWLVTTLAPGFSKMVVPILMKIVGSLAQRWAGDGLADFFKGYSYWINYLMPTNLPSTAEATEGYLNGSVSDPLWRCWTRANNDLETPARTLRDGRRTKPSILEAIQLYRWGKLPPDKYDAYLRQNGILYPEDKDWIEQAAVALPGVSDLISFMVKDVADPNIVDTYQLDQDFEAKWTGELAAMGDAQGITEEIARFYWRAHWNYPSPEQAFRMMQRLRPGRVPEAIQTTEADVLKLLEVNDYAPFWRERLLKISYMPLTRTDVQRAYEIDAVTKAQVKEAYLDEGYNDRDAGILADFTEKLKVRTLQQRRPPAEASRYVKYYLDYAMTLADLKLVLKGLIFETQVYEKTVQDAEQRRALNLVQAKLKRYRLQFTKGQWDEDFTKRALLTIGMKDGDADDLITIWKGDRPIVLKHITAAQVCKAANTNLITREEQATRLVNLGYTAADAMILIGECKDGLTQKQQAAAEKRAKQQEAANAKTAKQQAAALKADIAALKKQYLAQIRDLNAQIIDLNRKLQAGGGGQAAV